MKNYFVLEKWDTDYEGAAIYSLVGDDGKRYIGQATHLQRRLDAHRQAMNKIWKRKCTCSPEGSNLVDAVLRGVKFKVEVLRKIPWTEASVNNLRYWEKHYFNVYGGFEGTYNTGIVYDPVWSYEPGNEVELSIDLSKTDADILARLREVENIQGYIKDLIRQDMKKRD